MRQIFPGIGGESNILMDKESFFTTHKLAPLELSKLVCGHLHILSSKIAHDIIFSFIFGRSEEIDCSEMLRVAF